MAITPRPPKAFNTNQYQTEVAAGKLDILDVEVDDDLDTIYRLCNGLLDDANIAANAAINYSKLFLTAQIRDRDISTPGAPPTFGGLGINGSKIQPGTFPSSTVIITDKHQFAPGTTTWSTANYIEKVGANIPATETVFSEVTWDTRGAFWLAIGRVTGQLVGNPQENFTLFTRLLVGGTSLQPNGSEADVGQVAFTANLPLASGQNIAVPFSITLFVVGLGAFGPPPVKQTLWHSPFLVTGSGAVVTSRHLTVWELA